MNNVHHMLFNRESVEEAILTLEAYYKMERIDALFIAIIEPENTLKFISHGVSTGDVHAISEEMENVWVIEEEEE